MAQRTPLFGYGAGAFSNYASAVGGDEVALFEVVMEFGLVGAVAWFCSAVCSIRRRHEF